MLEGLSPPSKYSSAFQRQRPKSRVFACVPPPPRKRFEIWTPSPTRSKTFLRVNAQALTTHFVVIEKLITDNAIDEYRFFNLDEVGVTPGKDAHGKLSCRRLMPRRGNQDFKAVDFSYLNGITMMAVDSAAGEAGPPLIIVKGKKIPYRDVLQNGNVRTETPAAYFPRGSVLATRAEGGGVDRFKFLS